MKKKLITFLLCLLIIPAAFILSGCTGGKTGGGPGGPGGGEGRTFTITYMVDGQVYQTQKGKEFGSSEPLIGAPSKDGYVFEGWLYDGDGYEQILQQGYAGFRPFPFKANVTLTAKYLSQALAINFNTTDNFVLDSSFNASSFSGRINLDEPIYYFDIAEYIQVDPNSTYKVYDAYNEYQCDDSTLIADGKIAMKYNYQTAQIKVEHPEHGHKFYTFNLQVNREKYFVVTFNGSDQYTFCDENGKVAEVECDIPDQDGYRYEWDFDFDNSVIFTNTQIDYKRVQIYTTATFYAYDNVKQEYTIVKQVENVKYGDYVDGINIEDHKKAHYYNFDIYYYDEACEHYAGSIGSSVRFDDDQHTFYVKYYPITYVIRMYSAHGGEESTSCEDSIHYTVESDAFSIDDLVDNNYYFISWQDEYGNTYKDFPKGSHGDLNLTAVWDPKIYNINYVFDDGRIIGSNTNQTTFTFETPSFDLIDPVVVNYDFIDWYDNAELKGTPITNLPIGTSGDRTFYAKTTPTVFNITYEDTVVDARDLTQTYTVEDYSIKIDYKYGYNFDGFFNVEDDTLMVDPVERPSYGDLRCLNIDTTKQQSDITLTSRLSITYYTITYTGDFDKNNDTLITTYTVNDAITFSGAEKLGYTWKCWKSSSGRNITRIYSHSFIEDLVVSPVWNLVNYNITYVMLGEEGNSHQNNPNNVATYTIEDEVTLLDAVGQAGYQHDTWYYDEAGEQVVENNKINVGTTGDITVYASFSLVHYTITYNLYEGADLSELPTTYTIFDELYFPCMQRYYYRDSGWSAQWENPPEAWNRNYGKEVTIEAGRYGNLTMSISYEYKFQAYDQTIDGKSHYTLMSYNSDYTYEPDDFVIPSEIDGKTVTAIDCRSQLPTTIKTLFIPNTIEYIDNHSFTDCTELEQVAFESQSKLEKYRNLFYSPKMQSITIPNSVKELVISNTTLKTINVEDNSALETVVIDVNIGPLTLDLMQNATIRISGLVERLNISNSSQSQIEVSCEFEDSVSNVVYGDNIDIKVVSIGVMNSFATGKNCNIKVLYAGFENTTLTSLNLGQNSKVVRVDTKAFSGASELDLDLTISSSVTSIDNNAFYNTPKINIIFEDFSKITDVGEYAFTNNNSYFDINNSNLVNIGKYAFDGANLPEDIVLPASVKFVGYCAFAHLTNLKTLTFAGVPDKIEGSIIQESNAVEVTLPYAGYSISEPVKLRNVLGDVFEVEKITILGGTVIPENCFVGFDGWLNPLQKIKYISLPATITTIGAQAFRNIQTLETVLFNGNNVLTEIGEYAFANCYNLKHTDAIPSSIKTIGAYAFEDTSSLSIEMTFDALETAGQYAFSGCGIIGLHLGEDSTIVDLVSSKISMCGNLLKLTIPASAVNELDMTINSLLWVRNLSSNFKIAGTSRTQIVTNTTDEFTGTLTTTGNFITFEKDGEVGLYAVLFGEKNIVNLPSNITYIRSYCMSGKEINNIDLTNLTSLKTIGDYAFNSSGAKSIVIPKSVEKIGQYAFAKSSLEEVAFEEGSVLTHINAYAFEGTKLKQVIVPYGVAYIGYEAFYTETMEYAYIPETVVSAGGRQGALEVFYQWFHKDAASLVVAMQAAKADLTTNVAKSLNNISTKVVYEAPMATCTIEYYDEDQTTLLETVTVNYWTAYSVPELVPTKDNDETSSYTFEKWVNQDGTDIEITNYSDNYKFYAKYTATAL